MNPYSFSVLCFVFCSLFVGILVWLKRPDEVGKLFFWHATVIAIWGIGVALMLLQSTSYAVALWAVRASNAFAALIPVAWFHFILALTGSLSRRKTLLKFLYFIVAIVWLVAPTPWFVPELRPILEFAHYTKGGPAYNLLTLIYFLTVPLGFCELIKKISKASAEEQKQFLSLLIVSVAGYLGGSLTFLPVYGISFPQYGLFLLPIYPFGLAYVITRTSIFEMEKLAQAAHRDKLTAIGVLAASINHEIRNPLFIIKGLAESCLDRQKEGVFSNDKKALESANDAMKRSVDQADRAMDIIKRLSMFAKAGIEGEMKFEAVSIAEVLEGILPLVRYELAANNIALTREFPKDLPSVQADRRYLEEVFFNLIVNACQALKEKSAGGEIIIRAASEQDKVRVIIQDNGLGIPADKLAHVFRPFYTTKVEGTGLGLFITQQLVEKIKGRIEVLSATGQGTAFTVCLPH